MKAGFMPPYTETEVKLIVPDLEVIRARLDSAGATLESPRIYERNVRYENAAGTLSPQGIVVRLRQDTRVRLTYKEDKAVVDGISTRLEAEVEVSDFAAMELILGKLGYHPHLIYEKYRTTYTLAGAEIVLDELPYGTFVEIEGDKTTIESVINRLGLTGARRYAGSYVVLFEAVKARLGLTFTDLTFANFEEVDAKSIVDSL
jgi:adenylate cyclase class 2